MFFKTLLSKALNGTSALILGVAFTTASQAMMQEESPSQIGKHQVYKIKVYADLVDQFSIKSGDLLLPNIGHGMVQSSEWVTKKDTEASLFKGHEKFMKVVEKLDKQDHQNLTKKLKFATGDEFVKIGEKGLPTLLDNLSNSGVYIIPISNRCDEGTCDTNEIQGKLSRTEKEFIKLGYNYTSWKKPVPFQNPNTIIELKNPQAPENHGAYHLRKGIIYSISGELPHKSTAIVGLNNILKEMGQLPSALYFIDGESTIDQTAEDLKDIDFGITVHLLKYSQPQAFRTAEDLKEFYIHRLADKFKFYETQFNEIFFAK